MKKDRGKDVAKTKNTDTSAMIFLIFLIENDISFSLFLFINPKLWVKDLKERKKERHNQEIIWNQTKD